MKGGAPSDNCSAREHIIRAFSNLVNVGGPVAITPVEFLISTGSWSIDSVIISRFLITSMAR